MRNQKSIGYYLIKFESFSITVFGQSKILVRGLSTTPARLSQDHPVFVNEDPAKNPERDLVNFPRRKIPAYEAPTRHFIFPEEWFTFFHEKTGNKNGTWVVGAG